MNVVKVTYRKKRDESKLYVENIELGKYVCVCTGMYIIHYIFGNIYLVIEARVSISPFAIILWIINNNYLGSSLGHVVSK